MIIKNVPVKVVADILGKSEQFVRCGLQFERLKFGVAVTSNPTDPRPTYSYHVSPKLFCDYAGCTEEDIVSAADRLGMELKHLED